LATLKNCGGEVMMDKYDVVVVGGGIAGSVAARFLAERGLRTLLLEKHKNAEKQGLLGYSVHLPRAACWREDST